MVARKFVVRHNDSAFDVDYDTDDGLEVFKFQLFSLTSIPPHQQQILVDDDDHNHGRVAVLNDEDLTAFSTKLKVVPVEDVDVDSNEEGTIQLKVVEDVDLLKSDEELARMLQAEEEALMLQEYAVRERGSGIEDRIRPYIDQVLMYEDPMRQEAARKTVPVDELEEKALVALAKEGNFKPSEIEQDHAFLLQLLFWFKQSFRWVNSPPCNACGSDTVNQGMGVPLPSETQYRASRVELYHCSSCREITRFPRYNDPLKLLETRSGRCGEWANCFTLYCRAFGYQSRWVIDFNDHVWTECFSQLLGRWMHLDPCEAVYDRPLLYEKGWNKKMNYVIAIAKDGVYDVTKRYTRKWPEVLSRRNICTESALSTALSNMTKECRRGLTSEILSVLEVRDKSESEKLERDLHSAEDVSVSLPGRQSGDEQWRISRSEIGSNQNGSLSCSSCPIRLCVDEHVTRIYCSLHRLLSQFDENSFSGTRVVEILRIFKGILLDLKNSSYKTRRSSINPFFLPLLSYFDEFLSALSLKTDGKVNICLAAAPVKTSLSLPVALDALDDMIQNLNNCYNLKASFSFPCLKLKRLHSGLVLSSGEELPFGTATSAFDGLHASKWEEPNGARGCWLIYKLPDSQMHELVAYDIMSANDVPERDPMDWVVEGSDDGGSSWHVLDKQTSCMFEKRFQRKSFKISSTGFPCNIFRFRFLAVKDVQSNPRLQLCGIDLYTGDE